MLLVLVAVLLSGCWDVKDINKRALPVAMAIDIADNGEYMVYLLIPSMTKSQSKAVTLSRSSSSISKAIDKMARDLDRSLEMLHIKLIIVSEKLARRGIGEVLDYCMRTREVGAKTLFCIAQGDAKANINSEGDSYENIGASFQNFFSAAAGWTPEVSKVYLYQAFRDTYVYSEDTAFPILAPSKQTKFTMVGTALMKAGRMVDVISPEETMVYNIYRSKLRGGVVQAVKHGTVRVLSVKQHHKHSLVEGHPVINTRLDLQVTVLERKNNADYGLLVSDVQEYVKGQFENVLEKSQKQHSDILGLGQYFRNEYTVEELKSWKTKQLPHLKLILDVHVNIRNSGMIR